MKKVNYFEVANLEPTTHMIGQNSGNTHVVRKFTFGCLYPDADSPLVNVSVSNSSLSIDLWVGCALQCSYCHVQDTALDMPEGKMPTRLRPRSKFTVTQILDELEKHPFFLKDSSVLSIGTASTEPFASQATESTMNLMEEVVQRGWQNPIWIVTKAGFPFEHSERLRAITRLNKVMISFCWADNPKEIEPAANNRFKGISHAKQAGAMCAWYMRPLTVDWGANSAHLHQMIRSVAEADGPFIDVIVPGGLRWTQGIEFGMTEVRNLQMPQIPKNDNLKDLPDEVWACIEKHCLEYFPGIPVYRKSSCALSLMLGKPSITSTQTCSPGECRASICTATQRARCGRGTDGYSYSKAPIRRWSEKDAQALLDQLGIPAVVMSILDRGINSMPPMEAYSYAIQQTVLKFLAQGPEVLETL